MFQTQDEVDLEAQIENAINRDHDELFFSYQTLKIPQSEVLNHIPSYLPQETIDFFREMLQTTLDESLTKVELLFSEDFFEFFQGLVSLCFVYEYFGLKLPPKQIIPTLLQISKSSNIPLITYLITKAIDNICAEDSIQIVENGALPFLIQQLDFPLIEIAEVAFESIQKIDQYEEFRILLCSNKVILAIIRKIQKCSDCYLTGKYYKQLDYLCSVYETNTNKLELKTVVTAICQLIQCTLEEGKKVNFHSSYYRIIGNCTSALLSPHKFIITFQFLSQLEFLSNIIQQMLEMEYGQEQSFVCSELSKIILPLIDFIERYLQKYFIQEIQEPQKQKNLISQDIIQQYYENIPQYQIFFKIIIKYVNRVKYCGYLDILKNHQSIIKQQLIEKFEGGLKEQQQMNSIVQEQPQIINKKMLKNEKLQGKFQMQQQQFLSEMDDSNFKEIEKFQNQKANQMQIGQLQKSEQILNQEDFQINQSSKQNRQK